MSESVIRVDGLRKSFGGPPVLDGISFEVRPGETFALLGRNGAGKTTTIRILLGLLKPDAGSVNVAGCDPQVRPLDVRSRVGYLAEDQAMYEWMTPVELCRFLQPFYPTWDAGLTDKLLDRFELPRQTRIEHLSKGQTVKLGLAVALAYRPEIAILDDPALGLDPIARKEFNRDLIDWLQAEGRTVVYSSHLLDEVETVADRVAHSRCGTDRAAGTDGRAPRTRAADCSADRDGPTAAETGRTPGPATTRGSRRGGRRRNRCIPAGSGSGRHRR